ncbi:MAG: hypothetical protein IKR36_02745 [Clostridia bacterium]|nr:hypothetical protein [Clostridia bacterium]MBR6299801.1 hypothetical protein [Clostridia bacterium]
MEPCTCILYISCVSTWLTVRSIVTIDCRKVEDAFTDNMYERSELDSLLFIDPAAYADLVLNEAPGRHLNAVTQYKTDESMMLDEAPITG